MAAGGAAGIIGNLRIIVDADTSKAQAAMRKMGGYAATVGTTLGVAMGVAGVAALRMGDTYDKAMDSIRIGTGATGDALGGLTDDFKAVAGRVTDDVGTIGQVLADLNTRTGQTGDGLRDLTENVLDLSRMTGGDAVANVARLTRLYGDWSIAAENQIATNDSLLRVSQATGATIENLADAVVQYGAPLRGLGVNLETSIALLGKWEKEGVNVETMLQGMRMAVKTFAAQGLDPTEAFPAFVESLKDMDEATGLLTARQIVGGRAFNDFYRAAVEGRFDVEDLIDTYRDGADTVKGLADETRDAGDIFKELGNIITTHVGAITAPLAGIAESMGNAIFLLPALTGALGNALGRLWTKAGMSNIVKGAATKAGMVAGQVWSLAVATGAKLMQVLGALWMKLPIAPAMAAGTRMGKAFGVAWKLAAVVAIAAIADEVAGPLQEAGKSINEQLTKGVDHSKGMLYGTVFDSLGDGLNEGVRNLMLLDPLMSEEKKAKIRASMHDVGVEAIGALNRSLERGSEGISSLTIPPPTMKGAGGLPDLGVDESIRAEFKLATEAVAAGFGSVKQALANPPQMISKDDRLTNMAARMKKVMANIKKATEVGDPMAQRYWEKARAKQQQQIDTLKSKTTASLGQVKSAYQTAGVKVGQVWETAKTKTTNAARTGADNAIRETQRVPTALQNMNLTGAGIGLMTTWAAGIRAGTPAAVAAATEAAAAVAAVTVGTSPPPKGPLHTIDKGGRNVMEAWLGGFDVKRAGQVGARLAAAVSPQPAFGRMALAGGGGGQVHIHIGTLIADDKGLDELDRRMQRRQTVRNRGPMRYQQR